jgi:endoglucanase
MHYGVKARQLRTSRSVRALVLALAVATAALGGPQLLGSAQAASLPNTNLLTGETVLPVSTVGSWQAVGAAPLSPQTWDDGTASVTVTSAQAGEVLAQTGPALVGVQPGALYSGRVDVRAATSAAPVSAQLRWFTSAGDEVTVDRVSGYTINDGAAGWTSFDVAGLAPATAAFVTLGVDVVSAAAGETHYLARPLLTVSTGGSSRVTGPLRTVGNKVVDGKGMTVVLRGMNRSGQYDRARPTGLTSYDISRIKAWGANVVRVTLGQQLWLPGCASYDSTYASAIDDDVSWITSAGMIAVLDLQWNDPTCDSAGLNPLPDSSSVTFWHQVAKRYQSNPLVAFDLFNEPHDVTSTQWRDGGTVTSITGAPYKGVGMKALYDAVRGTGATNLVLIGGTNWASQWPTTAPLASTSNVVYAVHAYNCDHPSACTNGTGISWLLDPFVTPGKTSPIMVSEFGWPSAGAPQAWAFNSNVIKEAEANGWSWSAWDWDRDGTCAAATWFNVISPGTCGPAGTYEPGVAGQPLLTGLAKNS